MIPLGIAWPVTPFVYEADGTQLIASIAAGLALIALSLRRGAIRERHGSWQRLIR